MNQKVESVEDNPHRCVHYWIVEQAEHDTSEGRCCKCMEIKRFYNRLSVDVISHPLNEIRNRSSWLFAE